MKSLKKSFIFAYEAIVTCHYPVYLIRLQKEGQIPAKLSFAGNGSETFKTVETDNLLQRALKMFIFAIFQNQWDLLLA